MVKVSNCSPGPRRQLRSPPLTGTPFRQSGTRYRCVTLTSASAVGSLKLLNPNIVTRVAANSVPTSTNHPQSASGLSQRDQRINPRCAMRRNERCDEGHDNQQHRDAGERHWVLGANFEEQR
jgi:hypothetical protein